MRGNLDAFEIYWTDRQYKLCFLLFYYNISMHTYCSQNDMIHVI